MGQNEELSIKLCEALQHAFTDYFCDQSDSLISLANKNRITMPVVNYNVGTLYDKAIIMPSLRQLSTKNNLSSLKLSPRQLECASYLVAGISINEIAEATHLSPRTIEFYLANIKKKFGCRTRSQLIVKLMEIFAR